MLSLGKSIFIYLKALLIFRAVVSNTSLWGILLRFFTNLMKKYFRCGLNVQNSNENAFLTYFFLQHDI